MPRTIKVETACGRCGRVEEATMELAQALKLEENDKARDTADDTLSDVLNDALNAHYPDVVIAVRNSSGSYDVKGQRNLCDQPDAKRNKGCATRVKVLLDDVFMVPKPKKVKSVTPTGAKAPLEADKSMTDSGDKDKVPKKK